MDKDSILPIIDGNELTTLSSKIKANNPPRLTNNQQLAYFCMATAKNSSQNWSSELHKMHSRILRGFFYARVFMVDCAIMMGCVGEPLVHTEGSPISLCSGKTNPVQSVTLQLVLEMTVSEIHKETNHV